MKEISIQDMKDYMIAAAIFAQGQPENFHKSLTLIEDLRQKGLKPKIVNPDDVPDDALVCQVWQRAGGGYQYKEGELKEFLGSFKKLNDERDWRGYGESLGKLIPELSRTVNEEIYGYMAYCTSSSQGIVPMYISALEGKPFIDGDCCGTAMHPHLDKVSAVEGLSVQLAITPYGETVMLKDVLPFRSNFIVENIHRISGCWFLAMATGLAPFKNYKKVFIKNHITRLIKVGRAVRKARKEKSNPVEAFMKTAPADKLFEGEVVSFTLNKTGGRVHGDFNIKGSGEFTDHKFRVWYFMENRISWLDGKPYVTIPDINGIVDSESCECLSVLDHDHVHIVDGMYNGRKVAVLGVAANKIWYELEGAIDAVNTQLKAYGFNVKHQTIKEAISV